VNTVIDLASRRRRPVPIPLLHHPAGVVLPADGDCLSGLIAPEVRAAICSGEYGAAMIERLPDAVHEHDNVLVVGSGLGLLSSAIAQSKRADCVVVVEPDAGLSAYVETVHGMNGVPWIETVNAFPALSKRGRIPFFARRDPQHSSLQPDEGEWIRVSMTPIVDLELVLADMQIDLIVWDGPVSGSSLLAEAHLGPVKRILVRTDAEVAGSLGRAEEYAKFHQRGFVTDEMGSAVLFWRSN
jgi:hypothetical protein